ncbi:MAG: DEAD/DEAH box helicase [Erysipelotrichaceae bacterium]|nr:DEAD/DEAH box helicase [Erysipelotrichaceae bacterium]
MIELTLKRLKNTNFPEFYKKFILSSEIESIDKQKILELAVLFINSSNQDVNKLGYRIILKYCNKFEDYIPLYDIAINEGLMPIVKTIELMNLKNYEHQGRFFYEYQSAFTENFRRGDKYLTEEQMNLISFFEENNDESIAVVAPTSYGKSDLIMELIQRNPCQNVCILVPTKSLLAQTKKRIINHNDYNKNRKIITHPEMHIISDTNFIAVLTQERLLRLLQQDKDVHFEFLIVDEAHNLLDKDKRSELLATSIIILKKRYPSIKIKYLTPFLLDTSNLKLRFVDLDYKSYRVIENIKSENYFYYDFFGENVLRQYDQFMNEHYLVDSKKYINDVSFVTEKSSSKNVVYLNKPVDINSFSRELIKSVNKVQNHVIFKAIEDISSYIHPDYSLIPLLEKGIVYHHGSVPDNVRLYIEYLFTTVQEVKYLITTSTLLEGVNIPADTIFLLDYKKGRSRLSHAQFKNLVGRVSRFGDIFDSVSGSLQKLEPKIYIIKSEYMNSNANLENFISDLAKVNKEHQDETENVLLLNNDISNDNSKTFNEALEFIENQEPGTIIDNSVKRAKTEVGKLCYKYSITEFNIIMHEESIQNKIESLVAEDFIASSSKQVMDLIALLFVKSVPNDDTNLNIKRLEENAARNFYKMILEWRIEQKSYREMVSSFTNYWSKLIKDNEDTIVYVGKWGDETKKSPNTNQSAYRELWTDISKKSRFELVNLAIVRIKEEQDFFENILLKFIEVLFELGLIENRLYLLIKYGTDDDGLVTILKNGIGLQTAKLIKEVYSEFIRIDNKNYTIFIDESIIKAMIENKENELTIFEVKTNTRSSEIDNEKMF